VVLSNKQLKPTKKIIYFHSRLHYYCSQQVGLLATKLTLTRFRKETN